MCVREKNEADLQLGWEAEGRQEGIFYTPTSLAPVHEARSPSHWYNNVPPQLLLAMLT